jgi:hypothetical protein
MLHSPSLTAAQQSVGGRQQLRPVRHRFGSPTLGTTGTASGLAGSRIPVLDPPPGQRRPRLGILCRLDDRGSSPAGRSPEWQIQAVAYRWVRSRSPPWSRGKAAKRISGAGSIGADHPSGHVATLDPLDGAERELRRRWAGTEAGRRDLGSEVVPELVALSDRVEALTDQLHAKAHLDVRPLLTCARHH